MEEKKRIMMDLEKDAGELFSRNMKALREKANCKANMIAEEIGISPACYSKYVTNEKVPPVFPFLVGAKEYFGYSIDELLFTDLSKEMELVKEHKDDVPEAVYEKYYGLYQGFYFDNSAYKGRESAEDATALKSCVLLVYKKKANKEVVHKVLASFGMTKETAQKLYEDVAKYVNGFSWENAVNYMLSRNKELRLYQGKLKLSSEHVYIDASLGNKDKVSMIFYNTNYEKFVGGLGTVSSVSCGRHQEPVIQYLGLSRYLLNTSKEEICTHLLTSYRVKINNSMDDLMEMIDDLYNNGRMSGLNAEEKRVMIRFRLEKIVNDTLSKNLFRRASVSERDDEDFRNFILRLTNNQS